MNKSKFHVQTMAELALLVSVILIMAYTPLGYLKTPWGVEITFIVIPIAVGAVMMGPKAGAFLGLVFGLTSFAQSFTGPMGAMFLQAKPVGTFLCCVVPRILIGFLPGVLYAVLVKVDKLRRLRIPLCCFLTPALNTLLYIVFNWLVFQDTWLNLTLGAGYTGNGGISLLGFMFGMVAVNGIVEAIACLTISTAVCRALQRTLHRTGVYRTT